MDHLLAIAALVTAIARLVEAIRPLLLDRTRRRTATNASKAYPRQPGGCH